MTNPSTDPKLTAATNGVAAAEQQLAYLQERIDALSAEADVKRAQMQMAFKEKYATTFADFNVPSALSGLVARHTISVAKAVFTIQAPSGDRLHKLRNFAADHGPGDTTGIGPISEVEATLLGWLASAGVNEGATSNSSRDLTSVPPPELLKLIRGLPAPTAAFLATRSRLLESYLNVCLELDLGNS